MLVVLEEKLVLIDVLFRCGVTVQRWGLFQAFCLSMNNCCVAHSWRNGLWGLQGLRVRGRDEGCRRGQGCVVWQLCVVRIPRRKVRKGRGIIEPRIKGEVKVPGAVPRQEAGIGEVGGGRGFGSVKILTAPCGLFYRPYWSRAGQTFAIQLTVCAEGRFCCLLP